MPINSTISSVKDSHRSFMIELRFRQQANHPVASSVGIGSFPHIYLLQRNVVMDESHLMSDLMSDKLPVPHRKFSNSCQPGR